jgi:HD superfamily phosphohydrolase
MSSLVEYLAADFTEPVRDPLWGNIFLTPRLEELSSSPPFATLGRIKQLGPAYLVYPGATHSRRAHSLGVFHMAMRLSRALAARGELGFVGREGLASYLVAALCHDIGHFPFAHSLKELPLLAHESLAARRIVQEPFRSLVGLTGADPELAAAIVDEERPDRGNRELRFFRSLLSGVLDPDKLDYLNRDAFFCGVPYGVQDSDFILQRVRVADGDRLGIEERGLMSVESLLFSKYLMYRSVYWHRGVRSATAMIKKAVFMALREGVLAPEDLYGLDDELFFAKLLSSSYAPFALAQAVFEGRLFVPVLDLAFDSGDRRHSALLDLDARITFEEGLSSALSGLAGGFSALDLVVDIPESVSFETELPILAKGEGAEGEGQTSFMDSNTVFAAPVVAGFAATLRRLRVFVSPRSESILRVAASAARERLA